MNFYVYSVIVNYITDEEQNQHIVYGISVGSMINEQYHPIESISDIFFEYKAAESFAALCQKEQLSPNQLWDVVEDFLC